MIDKNDGMKDDELKNSSFVTPQSAASLPDASRLIGLEQLQRRIGVYDRRQILLWQRMSPAKRLEVADQAYHFALEAVRLTERRQHPDLSAEDLKWRVIRRMQGNQRLGREKDEAARQEIEE